MAGTVIGGQGIVPASTGATANVFNELTALTRRAFIPRVTVQLYFATPLMMLLMGNAQKSAGGLNQITGPVQGASMVQGAWTSYSGSFNKPQVIPGVQNFAFSTSYFVVPVPLVLGEALIQSTEAIVPILDVRMNDVYAVTMQQIATALFTNNTANPLMPSSLVDAYDSGTNVATYGGINRNTPSNSFWAGQLYPSSGAINTRANYAQRMIQVTDLAGGEAPDFAVTSPSDYATLNNDLIATEQVRVTPGDAYSIDSPIRSSFPNIVINGIPVFMDHFCPKGSMFLVNSKYTAMYMSEDAPFAFSGFYSTIPLMQIAQVGVMLLGYNVICTKPSSGAQFTGITGQVF